MIISARCIRDVRPSVRPSVLLSVRLGRAYIVALHPDTKARPPTHNRLFPVSPGTEVGYGCVN